MHLVERLILKNDLYNRVNTLKQEGRLTNRSYALLTIKIYDTKQRDNLYALKERIESIEQRKALDEF